MKAQSVGLGRYLLTAGVVSAGLLVSPGAAQTRSTTRFRDALESVKVLNEAWNFENSAKQRSLAYAGKADEEGYAPVASLFRATAQSQRIVADNLARAMRKLGFDPEARDERFEVRSTSENLRREAALHAGYRSAALPALNAALKRENFFAAMRAMDDVGQAETGYVTFLWAASQDLGSLRSSQTVTYLVCQECGYMTKRMNSLVCKVCFHSRDKHQAVT